MQILRFTAGLHCTPLAPAGVCLVGWGEDSLDSRVVASQQDLQAALHAPSGRAAIIEALGGEDRSWDPGPLVDPALLRALALPGHPDPVPPVLPWALIQPQRLRALRSIGGGGASPPGPGWGSTPRHALNLLMIQHRRVLEGEEVFTRMVRNVLDEIGLRMG
jgi:hypothetical protein